MSSGSFWGRGLSADRGERDLSGVEEFGAQIVHNCADEHGVGNAGDKVADVFKPGKRRQPPLQIMKQLMSGEGA